MTDPQTFWLNVTNAALGLVVLFCMVTVFVSAIYEVAARLRRAVASLSTVRDLAARPLDGTRTGASPKLG